MRAAARSHAEHSDPVMQFRDAMAAAGIKPPEQIIADGERHRFPSNGKNGDSAGWYVFYPDGVPAGAFGDWRNPDIWKKWSARPERSMSAQERKEYRNRMHAIRQQREAEQQLQHVQAAARASEIWIAADPAPANHPYLARKGVQPHGLRAYNGALVVPLRDVTGEIRSLQFIGSDGTKRFLSGGKTAGCYYSIGRPDGRIYIVEGLATGASIYEATGVAVAVAFSAGNLEAIARVLREKFPDVEIIIAADNDKSGTGQAKATDAARAVVGQVAIPEQSGMDWNDYGREHGPEALRDTLLSALSVPEGGISGKKPLPELPPVAAFEFALLPDRLRPWARDIVERIQCPPEYVAVTTMAALGAVIGRRVGVRPQERTDWTEFANQWALLIGRPGVLKSPAMEQALAPIKRLEAVAAEEYTAASASYATEAKLSKLQAAAAEKEALARLRKEAGASVSDLLGVPEPEQPTLKRYKTNDTTAASLGELVRQNPNGVLVYRDEMVSLFKGLDREDSAEARGFYLTGWNGNSSYTFDRIGRGLHLHIPAVCISMLGSTQPGRIADYIRTAIDGGAGDDGLIQRFGLLVWPDTSGEWQDVDRWPDSEARRQAHAVFERLDALEPMEIGAEQGEYDDAPYLRLANDALIEFRVWREGWEQRLRSGDLHPALESHLAKYRKLVPGLALIIHLADGGTGPVSHAAVLRALAWSEYLESHAVRAYASVTAPEVAAAKAILRRLDKGDLTAPFTARDIYRAQWAHLSDPRRVHEALSLLTDYGWLMEQQLETAGRPATVYMVMP